MKRIKKTILFLCAFCIIINLCSCAGYTRLSSRLIAETLFIEKTQIGCGVTVFEQQVDEKTKKRVYAQGENPILAVEQIGLVSGKRPLLSHVRLVAFSDNLSEDELLDFLELLSKDNQVPPEAQTVILKGCTGEIMAEDDKFSEASDEMRSVLGTAQDSSVLVKMTVADALSGYFDALSDLYMPVMEFEGENFAAQGTAVFKGKKMIGTLSTEETCSLLLLQKKGCRFFITAGDGCFNVTRTALKKKPIYGKDKRPCVRFTVKVYAVGTQAGISNKQAEKMLKEKLEADIEATAKKVSKEWKSDIYGLQTEVFLRHPFKKYVIEDIDTEFEIKVIMC